MRMNLTKWAVYFAMAAFAAMCLSVTNAVGQNGVCCVDTQQITTSCQSGCTSSGCSCTGHVTITKCAGGYGSGTLYQSASGGCCSSTLSTLLSPDGPCDTAATAAALALGTRGVFVRS